MSYAEFRKNKKFKEIKTGLSKVPKLNKYLFPFQKDITSWALKRGRACVFAGCGMGKTFIQLEWAYHIPGDTLIVAPLAVCFQTIDEAEEFEIDTVRYSNSGKKRGHLTITNYENLHKFNPKDYEGIVLDECFSPNTKVKVFSIDVGEHLKYIKDIRKGDQIINAYGVDNVHNIYKRRINRAVQVHYNGRTITCSENHPFFTLHGWKSAQDLQPGDSIMATAEAMRLVRGDFSTKIYGNENAKILQSILFSEMADVSTGNNKKNTYKGNACPDWEEEISMVQEWIRRGQKRAGEDQESKSNERSSSTEESIIDIAEDKAQTFRAWGKWNRTDITTAIIDGCSYRELENGIGYITGKTSTGFSNMLQSRLRKSRSKNSNRNGWNKPLFEKGTRQKERYEVEFFRVESVEILEFGDSRLDKYREKDGFIYFYDIKAEHHPSFTVNNALVHNSSIIKDYTSKYRNDLIDNWTTIPFRLACSATPAPNDYMELGNHAEFMGVMTRTEMLSMFFIHDGGETQKWRLKGHGKVKFFEWIASWAVMITKPSDLGYKDHDFILPKLHMHEITLPSKVEPGRILPKIASILQERQQARRETIDTRSQLAADIANKTKGPVLLWGNLNPECDAIEKKTNECVQVAGRDKPDEKVRKMDLFTNGEIKAMDSKPKIAGWGMNWQHCSTVIFVGLSDSFEQAYQALRRVYRFGQKEEVHCYWITSYAEGAVVQNIKRKEKQAEQMQLEMVKYMHQINEKNIKGITKEVTLYNPNIIMKLPEFLKGELHGK